MNIPNNGLRVLGVDIGGSSVKMGLLDGVVGLTDIKKVDTIVGRPEQMADLISDMAARYNPDIVGVGTAGTVNHKTGLVSAGNLQWRDIGLRRMLEERIKKPVWLDNDAQAALMAEAYSGVFVNARCAVYITLGTGVGGALMIDGEPWRGDDNSAFELGHMVTHADGELCACGNRGCYERYASSGAISRYAGGRSARAVIDGVLAGNAEDVRVFDVYIHELCIGIWSVINLFQPEVIALGGGVSAAGGALVEGVKREMAGLRKNGVELGSADIRLATHKNNAGMIGAAALALLHSGKKTYV